jgi:hypothetical protein
MPYYRVSGEFDRKGNKWRGETEVFTAANTRAAMEKLPNIVKKLNNAEDSFMPDRLEEVQKDRRGLFVKKQTWQLGQAFFYYIEKGGKI